MLALGVASAVLLFAAELARLSYRTIGIGGCESRVDPGVCTTTGGDAHSHVLWLIAIAVLLFAFGAAVGASRPATLALIACGIVVLVIALAFDLPKLDDLRGLEASYTQVRAHTGVGFGLEVVGGLLAVAAGAVGLMRRSRGPDAGSQVPGARSQDSAATASERAEARRRRRESESA